MTTAITPTTQWLALPPTARRLLLLPRVGVLSVPAPLHPPHCRSVITTTAAGATQLCYNYFYHIQPQLLMLLLLCVC